MNSLFEALPLELHSNISNYLRCIDVVCLSLTSPQLRKVYHPKEFEHIEICENESESENPVLNKTEVMKNLRMKDDYQTTIPSAIFFNPQRYSWFHTSHVRHVLVTSNSTTEGHRYPDIMNLYPGLKTFRFKHIAMLISNCQMLYDFCSHPRVYITPIQFYNFVPYLKSLQNTTMLPAQYVFIEQQTVAPEIDDSNSSELDPEVIDRSVPDPSGNSNLGLNDYYDEEMIFNEGWFNLIAMKIKNDQENNRAQKRLLIYKYPRLCVFPRHEWTDYLTSLTISMNKFRPLYEPFDKLLLLDNYTSLKKVSILDDSPDTFALSSHIYDSLERCQQLDELVISYDHGVDHFLKKNEAIAKINKLRGTWKKFKFNLKEFHGQGPIVPLKIKNSTITHVQFYIESRIGKDSPLPRYQLNSKVLKSLTFVFNICEYDTITGYMAVAATQSMNLQELNLTVDDLNGGQFMTIIARSPKLLDFPNVKKLTLKENYPVRFGRDIGCADYLNFPEYMAYYFDVINFGEMFKTLGEAVKGLRQLRNVIKKSSEKIEFNESNLNFFRCFPELSTFFECYDHGYIKTERPCCKVSVTPSIMASMYVLFAATFNQLKPNDPSDSESEYSGYQKYLKTWDEVFEILCKSFPSLSQLEFNAFCSIYDLIGLVHFQKFCKNRKYLDLTIFAGPFEWSRVIKPDFPYKDEWIVKAFQKSRLGDPYHIEIDSSCNSQIKHILKS